MGGLGVLAACVIAAAAFLINRQLSSSEDDTTPVVQRDRDAAPIPPKPQPVPPTPIKPDPKPEEIEVPPPPVVPEKPPVNPPERPPFEPPVFNPPPFNPPVVPPGPPPKPKVVFPLAEPVGIKAAPLAEDMVELKLPGTVTDACVGGGGRYWCLLLGDNKQVAIFDVNAAKVTKYLPVAGDKMRIAASMNKLVVAYPDTGVVTRFDLTTFEKEVTARAPVDKFDSIMMGAASAGPLYMGNLPVDLTTFKPFDAPPRFMGGRDSTHYRVSPNGHVIGSWSTAFSPSGLNVSTVGETTVKNLHEHTSAGFVIPAADGTTVTAIGVYGPTGKKLAGPAGSCLRLPAQEGRFYLTIPGGGGAQINTGKGDIDKPTVVYSTGDGRPMVNLRDVALPAGNEAWANTDFLADKKVLFTTEGKLIAVLDKTGNKLNLHKFDLESALDKAGIDYLFVAGRPPAATPGKVYKYTPTVKSKKGGLTFKLDAGPEGMKVAVDGTLTWDVPKDWNGGDSVILTIADKAGQEIFHTFTLSLAAGAEGGGVVVAPKDRPNPVAPADPKAGIVRPAAKPTPLTATKAADKAQIKLPGTVDLTCFGGGGRYVLMRIPSAKQVAVLDICEGKVTKYLPIPEDGALIAAGNEHLFVLAPTDNIIQRWNLETFEKERTAANPLEGKAVHLLIGHATDGPLFVVGPNKLLDANTFKEIALGEEANLRGLRGMWAGDRQYPNVNVSADGRVYAWHNPGTSPSGLSTMVFGPTGMKTHYEHTTVGAILPGPDGTLFTAGGLFTPELKPIGEKSRYQYWFHAPIPAAHGKLYIAIAPDDVTTLPGRRAAPKVSLRMVSVNKPLLDLTGLAGFDVPASHNQTMAKGLQLQNRVFLVPGAKAIAILHGTADKITIHKLDVEAVLDKAGVDYLFVTSRSPAAVCGQAYRYQPEVKSRKGGVKVKLDAGPDGMKVDADGIVTWAVPADFAEMSVSVIMTITDKSGQETFHTFTLPVARAP